MIKPAIESASPFFLLSRKFWKSKSDLYLKVFFLKQYFLDFCPACPYNPLHNRKSKATGKRLRAKLMAKRGAPKVQARYWQVRMKLSGKKDPAATISGKFPTVMTFRLGHRWGNPAGAACSLRHQWVSRPPPWENLSGP